MSYHIKLKDYNCPDCNALYIPYKEGMFCPSCKTVPVNISKEYLGFIDQLIVSLRVNKIKGNKYIPSAWYVGSMVDQVQSVIFSVFDILETKRPANEVVAINEHLNSLTWDNNSPYLKDNIKSICQEILLRKKELRVSLFTKLLSIIIP